MADFETKDSGERAQFESGMQRDTEAGKPRFDLLMPLGVPYEEQLLTRFAALLGRGAVKYEQRNWEQADSEEELARMKSSAFRHFVQWMAGERDEDHAAAVMFNLLAWETTNWKMNQQEDYLDRIADQILGAPSNNPAPTRDLTTTEPEHYGPFASEIGDGSDCTEHV